MTCLGSQLSLRPSCSELITGPLLPGQEHCQVSRGTSLSKGPFRRVLGLAMDFLKDVPCLASPWFALPTFSMFGSVRLT